MKLTHLKLVLLCLCFAPLAAAHNLKLTTAQVVLRSETHVSIRIETNMTDLTGRIDWPGKPETILELAAAGDDQIRALRTALVETFSTGMPVEVGGQNLQSQRVRIARVDELRDVLRSVVAHQIIPQMDQQRDAHQARHNDLVIHIDGFIAPSAKNRQIQIDFPGVLGPMTVSYVQPKTKTLKAGDDATRYIELLDG